jgi:hypothetical protein
VIPAASITAWGTTRPWPNRPSIEQDLLLARTIVALYEHPALRDELVFRGGTCLHQVHLPTPRRYSEDLDFVRRTHSGIGRILDAVREVAELVGLEVRGTKIGQQPKVTLRTQAEDDPSVPLRIKVEINTHETSPARPLIRLPFSAASAWFTGAADVLTFAPAELIATKLRALYQRKKGRDLFDLWLALVEMGLPPADLLASFGPYRPVGYTAAAAIANLDAKVDDVVFRTDLEPLVGTWPDGYDIDAAAQLVRTQLLRQL